MPRSWGNVFRRQEEKEKRKLPTDVLGPFKRRDGG